MRHKDDHDQHTSYHKDMMMMMMMMIAEEKDRNKEAF